MSADVELGLVYVPMEMPETIITASIAPVIISVRREHGRSGYQDWQAKMALPDGSSRPLGLGISRARRSCMTSSSRRPTHQGAGAANQAGISIRAESRNRRADLADRRAPGTAVRCPGEKTRPTQPFPTKPGLRPAGRVDRRSDRFHAGTARASNGTGQEIQARSDLYASRARNRPTVRSATLMLPRMSAERTGPAARSIPKRTASTSIRTRASIRCETFQPARYAGP